MQEFERNARSLGEDPGLRRLGTAVAALRPMVLAMAMLLSAVLVLPEAVWAASSDRYTVPANTVLYAKPDGDSTVVTRLRAGDRVLEFQRQGKWVRVGVLGRVGQEGWLPLSKLEPEVAAAPAEPEAGGDAAEAPDPNRDLFELRLSGNRNLYNGRCRYIGQDNVERRINIRGIAPNVHLFPGTLAARCYVKGQTNSSTMYVQLYHNGQLVDSDSTAATSGITVISPWTWASSR